MAIKSGRVGVREDQVDVHGRIIATDYLIEQIRRKIAGDDTDDTLPPEEELIAPPVNDTESN